MSRAAEVRAGHRQGSELVILDIEFNRSGQVKEVALIEYVSGRVLLNTLVKPQAPPELSQLELAYQRGLTDHLWSRKLDSLVQTLIKISMSGLSQRSLKILELQKIPSFWSGIQRITI